MATKKNTKETGFSYPVGGKMMPKGTKIKKNPDGTISYVLPNKKEKSK